MNEAVFYEEQKFTQQWVQAILYILWAGFLLLAVLLVMEKKTGVIPAALLFLFVSAFVLGFKNLKLQMKITADGIRYRFYPVQRRFRVIPRSDIARLELITYDALSDYGGWGIRLGKKGRAYTVKGNKGIAITLVSNKNILIGTSRPHQLELFLRAENYI